MRALSLDVMDLYFVERFRLCYILLLGGLIWQLLMVHTPVVHAIPPPPTANPLIPLLVVDGHPDRVVAQTPPKSRIAPPRSPLLQKTEVLIREIRIQGLQRLKPEEARRWIFSQEQEVFSQKRLNKDIERLRRTGYFRQVDARVRVQQGWAIITFFLQEHLGTIRAIYFVGSQNYNQEQLYSLIQMRPGMPFQRQSLEQDAREVIKAYHNLGYFRVKVTVQGRWLGQSLLLWFVIQENEPARIRRVLLHGNRHVPSSVLLPLLDSRAHSISANLAQRGFFHPSFVARDLYFLRNYYFDHGRIQSQVSGPMIHVSRDKHWVTLVYQIVEGPVFHYGDIQLFGDLIRSRQELRKIITVQTGQVFNRTQLYSGNIVPMLRFYRDQGYAFVQMQTLPNIDPISRQVHLQFRITKGPLVRVERIEIMGNEISRDRIIRRRILIKEGDLYSETKLTRSRAYILGSGFFENTDPQQGIKVEVQRGSQPDRVILRFFVKEKSTWLYNFGFSYLSVYGFIFSGRLGKTNLFGNGQTLVGTGLISTTLRLWQVALNFYDPHLVDTDLSLFLSGFISHQDSTSSISSGFLRDSIGANISLAYPLGIPSVQLGLTYRIAHFRLSPAGTNEFTVPISGYYTRHLSSGFTLRLSWDTRDSQVGTAKGWQLYASYEHVAPYFGADYTLHRWEAGARFYFRLPLQSILKFAATAGWSISPDANGVPPFERYPLDGSFFLLRGFEPNSVGPLRRVPASADPAFRRGSIMWGGTKKFLFNAEWILPLWNALQLGGVLFFDAGNAFDDNEWPFQDLRNPNLPLGLFMNLGIGIRWTLPGVGVARFEFGIPLTKRTNDPTVFFNFLVGESF